VKTLGNFEERLLGELRQVVADQAPEAEPARRGWATPRRRFALAGVGAGVLAAGVVVGLPALNGAHAPAAWAVEDNGDGTITAFVKRFEDADGLERALEAHGVKADVSYAPPGKECEWGRWELVYVPYVDIRQGSSPNEGPTGYSLTLKPAEFQGKTIVVEANQETETTTIGGVPNFPSSIHVGASKGPVAPCKLVDAPRQ
jgi:hypothetical protein